MTDLYSIACFSLEHGLNINRTIKKDRIKNLPKSFGAFVAVYRSIRDTLPSWPQNIHGCIGNWDDKFQSYGDATLIDIIASVSNSAVNTDDRRHYFKNSLFSDVGSSFKVYFMVEPTIFDTTTINDNEYFDNKTYGLIVQSS